MKIRNILAAAALFAGASAVTAQSESFLLGQWTEVQNAILRELGKSYVDTLPVKRMSRAAIDAMLSALDPYTVYIPEEENEDLQLMVNKTYGGIGAIIYKPERQGNVIINEPYEGSPAVKSGLRCGDEIIEIDGESTHGLDSKQCSEKMKGMPGTDVVFLVKKVHTNDTVTVQVHREQIHIDDIEYAGIIAPGVGYILQTGFTDNVSARLRENIEMLKKQGMKKLVLDLRGNGGGLLNEAVNIVSLFVPKGSPVVSSKGKTDNSNHKYCTVTAPIDASLPLVVLIDSGSASASEIVSGALQDYDRATIMGQRSFGKGLVQSIVELPYGGQLKVTTAKYYTPSGRCVQAIDYSHRNEDGSVGHIPDSLTHEFKTARGRIVRDGGGITPDVVLESPKYDDIVYKIVMGGYLEQYVLEYVRNHESIAPVDEFHFDDFEGFKEFLTGLGKLNRYELADLKPEQIIPFIEEELAVRYWFHKGGVRIRLRYDEQLKKALESPMI